MKLSSRTCCLSTSIFELLEKDGAAVAFPDVFRELHADMKRVLGRLDTCEVGGVTQEIQQDIMDTLKEMVAAVSKG